MRVIIVIMNVIKTAIDDVVIIEPKVFGDHRGYFFESFFPLHIDDFRFSVFKLRFFNAPFAKRTLDDGIFIDFL